MGISILGGSSAGRAQQSSGWRVRPASGGGARLLPGDPNPDRFRIVGMVEVGGLTAANIVWPDARNYEGRKIAVYRASRAELCEATRLDPHFQEERGPLVPIARFEPTEEGWRDAIDFIDFKARQEMP